MNNLEIININDNEYFNASDLHKLDPNYFYGCANNTRNIVKKNKIKDEYIFWAYKKKGEWVSSNKSYAKAKLLLTKEWTYDNVPMFARNNKATYDIEPAPPILELEDDEKLTDCDGNIMEIETRGEREVDECYFKVKDIANYFEMDRLQDVVIDKHKNYEINLHYKYFTIKITTKSGKTKVKKQLFFTYTGLVRCLYVSKNKHVDEFQKWASKTLFTVQMGTPEQKEELTAGILGVPAKSLRQILNKSSTNVPCVYRFALGKAKDLRKIMKLNDDIPDEYTIIKYGFTEDLVRRTSEHITTYESTKGVKLELMNYAYIDPKYLSEAETDIKGFFSEIEKPIIYKKFVELVAINPKHEKQIKKQFKYINKMYAGCVKDLIDKIEKNKIETKHMKEKHMLETEKKNMEIEKHKMEIEKHKMELRNKDLQVNQYKMELENSKLKLELESIKLFKK